jgi:phosphoglycerate dehydrogenase-like enzyme
MRLLVDAEVQPDTIGRLRALSPDLEVVDHSQDDAFDATALVDPDVEVIIGRRVPSDLSQVPSLRWLQVRSAGVNHLAADPPWRKGLLVTNARGVYAIPIAEYVTGMVLRVNQPAAWAAGQAAHRWPDDEPVHSIVRDGTAVIVGYGSIGREVARQLSALGMRIVAVKARPEVRADTSFRVPGTGDPDGSIPDRIVGVEGLVEAARSADVLVLTMPLTEATRGLIDTEVIGALRPSAWLVNVARGALVVEPALLEALRAGRLAGAVLDVFGQEPLREDSPWWDAPNVIVTPHASGVIMRYFDDLAVENVRRYLAGEPLLNLVDAERGY